MSNLTKKQQILLALWISLIIYSLTLAPLASDELEHTMKIFTFDYSSSNIVLFTVFSLMGIWPMVLAPLILYTNKYKLRPWPFWFMSFFLGFFALAPYVALRSKIKPNEHLQRPKWWQWWRSKMLSTLYALFFSGISLGFLSLIVFYKDLDSYFALYKTYRFVHVMTLDFLALHGLSLYLISEDRPLQNHSQSPLAMLPWPTKFAIIALPVFGPALYPIARYQLMHKAPNL